MNIKEETQKRRYDIVGGPNKDLLFDACKYAFSEAVKIPVNFAVAIGYTAPKSNPNRCYIRMKIANIKIVGVEHEDGSGESFNLRGYCDADLRSINSTGVSLSHYRFDAYYDSKRREGSIVFEKC